MPTSARSYDAWTFDKPSVGGDAHAVERSGTSTLGVHRPAAPAGAESLASLCEAAQCSHWVVRSEAKLRCHSFAVTEGEICHGSAVASN